MALAILEWMDADESNVWFRIDTGTNTQYQLKVGRCVREDADGEWVDDVYFSLPPACRVADADFFAPPLEVKVPLERFDGGRSYVQLFTSKDGGRAQAASEVVVVAGLGMGVGAPATALASSLSSVAGVACMNTMATHRRPRRIPNRMPSLSRQTSLESLLGEIVKVTAPVVIDLLKGAASKVGDGSNGGATDLLGQVLKSLLGALSASVEAAPKKDAAKETAVAADPNVSQQKSAIARVVTNGVGNRFVAGRARYARQMIFGIDDALIASLAGPILSVLPQLANAANQKRVGLKKADNDLVAGILSDINKRLMLDKLLDAQAAAQQQGGAGQLDPAQLQVLADLLARLPANTSGAKSLSMSLPVAPAEAHKLSNRAVLEFSLGNPVQWNDAQYAVFDRNHAMTLRPRFVVGAPVPKSPLPKAILKIVLHDAGNPDVRAEKIFKLTGVAPNTAIDCLLEPVDLAPLPQNTVLNVLAELRWRTSRGETRAYGSTELVLANKFFLKSRGAEVSVEHELTDMERYRAFWNKVWEAPALDTASGEQKKYNWELDVMTKFAAVLTASHDSNGFMETKVLQEATDAASLSHTVRGRMKSGIELSVAELNKLVSIWPGNTALERSRLEALNSRPFLESASRELKYRLRLKGRAGQVGMVWVIPTFKLFGLTLSAITATDATGQVTATNDEVAPFPLPVAARLIGLKSAA